MGWWKEMRAEVAVYTKWFKEEDICPAKKKICFVLNMVYEDKKSE